MTARRWTAGFAVVALLALVAALISHSGDDAIRPPQKPQTDDVEPDHPAAPPRRERAQSEAAPAPSVVEEKPVTPAATASVVVRVLAAEDSASIAGAIGHVVGAGDIDHGAKTDAAGVARFADLAPGKVLIWAEAVGGLRSGYEKATLESGRETAVEIRLDVGVEFEGVVLDAGDGRPIAGATVQVDEGGALGDDRPGLDWAPPLGKVVTDAVGRFSVRSPPDVRVTAKATARGYVARAETFRSAGDVAQREPARLRLESAGTMRGAVRDAEGRALPGAKVYVVRADQTMLVENPEGEVAVGGGNENETALKATTDASGRYELDGLSLGGSYVALAAGKGWARSRHKTGVLVSESAPSVDVDFSLRRAGSIVLHFVDPDGKPVPATLNLRARDASSVHRKVGDDGLFRLDEAEPTTYWVEAMALLVPNIFRSIDVAEGATTELTLAFERAVSIEGVAVDDRGEPVAGAQVVARSAWPTGPSAPPSFGVSVKSDVHGGFLISALRTGPYKISVESGGHETADDLPVDAPAEAVRLVTRRFARVTVRIVVPAGARPPTSFVLRGETLRGTRWVRRHDVDGEFGDGRLTVKDVIAGTCRVRFFSPEFATLTTSTIVVAPGASVDLGDVRLDPGVDVAGRVEDPAGAPVAGAQVSLGEAHSPAERRVVTAADGSFRAHHVDTGATDARVQAEGFASATARFDATAGAPLVVRLTRGALMRITVVNGSGVPVAAAHVVVYAPDSKEDFDYVAIGRADHRGLFETRLAAGKYRATIWRNESPVDVELADGVDSPVRLVTK